VEFRPPLSIYAGGMLEILLVSGTRPDIITLAAVDHEVLPGHLAASAMSATDLAA
jgi:hypothetical protein